MSVSSCGAVWDVLVGCPERVVDVEQRLLLALIEPRVGEHGQLHRPHLALVEVQDPGADVERLRRDAEPFRELLQHLCRGSAQSTFDLAQVRVRHTGLVGQLPKRKPGGESLLAQVVAEVLDALADPEPCHAPIVLTIASKCKPPARDPAHTPGEIGQARTPRRCTTTLSPPTPASPMPRSP